MEDVSSTLIVRCIRPMDKHSHVSHSEPRDGGQNILHCVLHVRIVVECSGRNRPSLHGDVELRPLWPEGPVRHLAPERLDTRGVGWWERYAQEVVHSCYPSVACTIDLPCSVAPEITNRGHIRSTCARADRPAR